MNLPGSVRRTIRRRALVPRGGRVVVALSGGGDSVALLHLLRELELGGELVVAGAAHVNHQLRLAADDDERFCRELCASLSLPLEVGRYDVRGTARRTKRSIEDVARELRYAFLHEAAKRLRADVIAVGHSRDDQAETFLLRIVRGAGARGLSSVRPRAGLVVRPLIDTSRADLRRYLDERQLSFREDETNADVSVPRNRVRHELLPYLAREFSANIVEVLARDAELAREDDERLEGEAIEFARSIVLTDTRTQHTGDEAGEATAARIELDVDALRTADPAIGSRVVRNALRSVSGGRFIGFGHVRRVLELARDGNAGQAVSLPGQQALHAGRRLVLSPGGGRQIWQRPNSFRIPLSIPGEVLLPEQRWKVSAAWADLPTDGGRDGLAVFVKAAGGPLAVRSRRPGDRFHPPGMDGRAKKLQDYFVDRKVPRSERDRLPLVVDRDDRIVWIVGHAVAEGFRAVTPAPGVILLKARQLGGEG